MVYTSAISYNVNERLRGFISRDGNFYPLALPVKLSFSPKSKRLVTVTSRRDRNEAWSRGTPTCSPVGVMSRSHGRRRVSPAALTSASSTARTRRSGRTTLDRHDAALHSDRRTYARRAPQQYPVASFPDVQLPSLTSELLEFPFATLCAAALADPRLRAILAFARHPHSSQHRLVPMHHPCSNSKSLARQNTPDRKPNLTGQQNTPNQK